MKYIQAFILIVFCLLLQSCVKQLKPYQYVSLDAGNNVIIAAMDTPVTKTEFIHTAMYILDSTNHSLKLNNNATIGIEIYNNAASANSRDTHALIGTYTYYFDTKEERINFK